MKFYLFNPVLLDWAESEGRKLGNLRGSITNGAGNVAGYLGQAIAAIHTGMSHLKSDSFEYDLGKHPALGNIEVKTKQCHGTPKLDYNCSVTLKNHDQACDTYVFCRVLYSRKGGWFLGWLPADEFKSIARPMTKGDDDPESGNGWKVKEDCLNVYIHQLHEWPEIRTCH